MPRVVRHPASFLSFALLVMLVPLALRMIGPSKAASALSSSDAVQVTVLRAGLAPTALAASGVSAADATIMVAKFKSAFESSASMLAEADAAFAKHRVATDQLRRKVHSGLASEAEVSALAQSAADLAAAGASREQILNDLAASATMHLTPPVQSTLQAIRQNAGWNAPTEFLVAERSQAEWVNLRDALSNERICAKYGDPVNPTLSAFLNAARSEQAVAMAKASSDANLASVELAMAVASGG